MLFFFFFSLHVLVQIVLTSPDPVAVELQQAGNRDVKLQLHSDAYKSEQSLNLNAGYLIKPGARGPKK